MVYNIVHHRTARRTQHPPLWLKTVYLHVPIHWKIELRQACELWRVGEAIHSVRADCRATTVTLTPSDEGFWMAPSPLEDNLSFKANIMKDLRRMLRLGQRVTVTITVC